MYLQVAQRSAAHKLHACYKSCFHWWWLFCQKILIGFPVRPGLCEVFLLLCERFQQVFISCFCLYNCYYYIQHLEAFAPIFCCTFVYNSSLPKCLILFLCRLTARTYLSQGRDFSSNFCPSALHALLLRLRWLASMSPMSAALTAGTRAVTLTATVCGH